MATRTWTDNLNVTTGLGGTVDNGDDLIFGTGGITPTTLDLSTKDVNSIHVGEKCAVKMGNETNGPLLIVVDNANTGRVMFSGAADWRVSGAAGEHFRTCISTPHGTTWYFSNGTETHLEVMAGNYRAASDGIVVNLYQGGGGSYFSYHATAITAGRVNGGKCLSDRVMTTCNVGGTGHVEQGKYDQTWGTVNMDGGRFTPKGGTITTLAGRAGILDCSKLEAALTITNSELWEGFEIINPPGQGSGIGLFITYTNAPTLRGRSVKGYQKTN